MPAHVGTRAAECKWEHGPERRRSAEIVHDYGRRLMRKRFTAKVRLDGKTATSLEVPSSVVHALGPSRRPPVRITVGGHTYRTTVAAYGNQFFVPLNRENRTAAGVKAGDTVAVSIEIDDAIRIVEVPDDFAKAMKAKQRTFFDALAFSHQREYVQWIASAKRADTRARRVERAIEMLSEQRTSPR